MFLSARIININNKVYSEKAISDKYLVKIIGTQKLILGIIIRERYKRK